MVHKKEDILFGFIRSTISIFNREQYEKSLF